jgi:pepF/M3 family oligoendopeptidase
MTDIPRWDLSNVYPGLESPEFESAQQQLTQLIGEAEQFLGAELARAGTANSPAELGALLGAALDRFNALSELGGTLGSYIQSFVTTDSRNVTAMKKRSVFQQLMVRVQMLETQFQTWVGALAPVLDSAIAANPVAQAHAFNLKEIAEQSTYLMSAAEENLAAELGLSGASAWNKLQGTLTSQLTVEFELDGSLQKLPMPALINLRSHPDAEVRRRAYTAENQAWDTVRETLAACMNGVKGAVNTLNQRRHRTDALHSAIDMARIDRPTLEAMLGAMHDSFPMFQRYFKAKARLLGKQKLEWWDLFAPLGGSNKTYTWQEAQDFIIHNFSSFSPELADFARHAFDHNWIDAEQRDGKRGGAFCMDLPSVQESRVLCNFDGSLDQVSTIAHELGHAFHNHCAYQAQKTRLQQDTPMTLAETASIMCETIVMQAMLQQISDPQQELAVLETMLNGDSQVIVDIYSRYLFEKEVFERRVNADLSPDELCEIMERAQKATYGDLESYQPYMWTWKPHYYYAGLSFYNFPYAFGLLFATGLYAIYQQRGADFIPAYKSLLANTGQASAADLAARFGIDIRSRKFWEDSLKVIEKKIERYEQL